MVLPANWHVGSAIFAVALAVGAPGPASPASEARFRVENKVYMGGEKEPQVRSTTIFYDGVIYDYLEDPAEVTIFDNARGRFVLLDLTRRIKTELTAKQVAEFTERLGQWSRKQSDSFLKFLGDPQFEEQFDESGGEWTFVSPRVTYRLVTTVAPSQPMMRQYREFADWYCQLNTLLNPGARPPFARMIINAALERRGRFPREVHLTLRPKQGLLAKPITVRSEHLLVRQLVESDRKRIAQTGQFMAIFGAVDFAEYQKRVAASEEGR